MLNVQDTPGSKTTWKPATSASSRNTSTIGASFRSTEIRASPSGDDTKSTAARARVVTGTNP